MGTMLPEEYQWILAEFEPDGDPRQLLEIAQELEDEGNLPGAATVYDRAYGLLPESETIRERRKFVLDRLSVVEHGICFRYIPEGVFLMGSDHGDHDERPWHPVWLSPYWLSETPISWGTYCRLMDWGHPPREAFPREIIDNPPQGHDSRVFALVQENKIRLQYCEDRTMRARDWHSHEPGQTWQQAGQTVTSQQLFGEPERDDPNAPWRYETKPMVSVSWEDAEELAERLSNKSVRYSLPTEAKWERAARGGLIGTRHAWGNEPPSHDRCDFDRFREFSILPMKTFAPNGYGLYAMNGCVWEWTSDWYDRDYYQQTPDRDPTGPAEGEEKVLRGGSWADCAEVITVTFRMSRGSTSWRKEIWGDHITPNIGFRLCRKMV